MYEFLHHYLETERKAMEPYEWAMRTYYPGGQITPTGEMFRQPNLAATLRALAAAEQAALAQGCFARAGHRSRARRLLQRSDRARDDRGSP